MVFFGAMTLAFDVAARRQYRVPRPWLGTLRRDVGPSVYALGLIPFGVYLASYAPWFASETAINRHEEGTVVRRRRPDPRLHPVTVALHLRRVHVPRAA